MESYGSLAPSSARGPLPVQWNSRKTVFSLGMATLVIALCLVAVAQQSLYEQESVDRMRSILVAARGSSALAEVMKPSAAGVQKISLADGTSSIDAAVADAQKEAKIAIAAAASSPSVDNAAAQFAADAQKQAAIAIKIADSMNQPAADNNNGIDADVKAAQAAAKQAEEAASGAGSPDYAAEAENDAKIALAAAGSGSSDSIDYAAEAKKYLAIAQKDAPDSANDPAAVALREAAIAIKDAGLGGGLREAEAQKKIAIAAAHGEGDNVSAARRAADEAMEKAELNGEDVDYAGQAKKELEIAIKAANEMGVAVKMPEQDGGGSGGGASAAAAVGSSSSGSSK